MEEIKTCTKCKYERPISEFGKRGMGLNSRCKNCIKEYKSNYYSINSHEIRKKHRQYYKSNFEKIKKKSRKWKTLNNEKVRDTSKKYYQLNKDRIKTYAKKYHVKSRLILSDTYIIRLLKDSRINIQSPKIIILKREQLKLIRTYKQKQNETK